MARGKKKVKPHQPSKQTLEQLKTSGRKKMTASKKKKSRDRTESLREGRRSTLKKMEEEEEDEQEQKEEEEEEEEEVGEMKVGEKSGESDSDEEDEMDSVDTTQDYNYHHSHILFLLINALFTKEIKAGGTVSKNLKRSLRDSGIVPQTFMFD